MSDSSIIKTYTAGGTIEKGRCVKLDSGDIVHSAANDDATIGVATESGESGDDIGVCVEGHCHIRVAAAVTLNGDLMSDSNGRAVDATTGSGEIAVAQALSVGAAASGGVYALAEAMVYARKTTA